ncbi:Cobyrinic acid ac-diamide synthase (plasmid) [Pseudarthrobacter chlorophenolicus A6]|uniref:Cobyrinic acid ac-diamide synthase n=2 Tax=Pseudarthrobacter chlorophenolicus TaxID=85085 RepID=B8HIZ7_PSECP|nr:Cobyrinic acid ac-diamide synthase [Pseudarthrobacter chlorophenolicus A6]SDQ17535.1 pilus assembly protein CpaE [Pseudarthrobacter chlorophenolicus]
MISPDAAFGQRVRLAISGLPGSMQSFAGTPLAKTPEEVLGVISDGAPQVILLGPGVNLDEALRLASAFDVQHPDISLVLVRETDPDLTLTAMRCGIRDILAPDAEPDTIRVLLERACQSAASRRRSISPSSAPEEPLGRIIAVAAAKGGVGKTTVATNIAVGLGRIAPMSTVLVDLDTQFGDVDTVLRIVPEHTLKDAVTGAAAQDTMVLKTLLSVHPASIYALCAPSDPADSNRISGEEITHMLRQLASEFRYVVVDTAPGLGEHTLAALEAATDLVLLCGMDVPSVRGARKELDVLDKLQMTSQKRHLVVNNATRDSGLSIQDIEATLGAPVNLAIPRSKALAYSTNQGEPLLHQRSRDKAAKALHQLVDRFDPESAQLRKGLHRRAGV